LKKMNVSKILIEPPLVGLVRSTAAAARHPRHEEP
jgi:hypothetical protein